ncbi:hypothetical protein [Marivirga arenosa]|uniref:Uncharacterized protein n=1 Tax=Marivirga arenosa TaxID=3059076 RepID=A0AA49GFA3_9BACT|nr:hypothetical protein [Marivirga sp. BKB1-2]WKK82105.2 hypothetical protein QYS47_08210 [Marivirga sp. BKB1-2]
MNDKQKKIIEIILEILHKNSGKCNSDQISSAIENNGYDFYDEAYQDSLHILTILKDQNIIRSHGEPAYYFELTDFGYQVISQGYQNWLNERDKIGKEKNKNIILSNRLPIIAIVISALSVIYVITSDLTDDSYSDLEGRINQMEQKLNADLSDPKAIIDSLLLRLHDSVVNNSSNKGFHKESIGK